MKYIVGVFCSLIMVLCIGMAHAVDSPEELDKKAYDLYQKVFSPFCPGRSLNDCPSSKAQELKAEMRGQLESGVPPEVILEGVFETFGQKYRAIPQYSGVGKLVWWVPLGFLGFGIVIVLLTALHRRKEGPQLVNSESTALAPETKDAIEKELATFDS